MAEAVSQAVAESTDTSTVTQVDKAIENASVSAADDVLEMADGTAEPTEPPPEAEVVEEKPPDPINGKLELQVTPSSSLAEMSITPPFYGGEPVSEEMVYRELKAIGVVSGINAAAITEVISKQLCNHLYEIATWTPPVDGVGGEITYLFPKTVENKPKEDERGFVDYKDLGVIRNIKQGTIVGTISLPTEGTAGINVRGVTVAQKKGVAVVAPIGENISLSGDGTVMRAIADGNLKFSGSKFAVETVFNMRGDVDGSTGNLDFIGDIVIRGEVMEGFRVSSQKSVTVHGNVTGSTIEAGGDVTIKKGCINSKIVAHGNVYLDFIESSDITCDGDIKGDAFITSNIYCGGELTAQGKKGILMGGKYTCLKNLIANSIGTKSYAPTIVTVGDNAIMLEERAECEKRIKELDFQITRNIQDAEYLTQKQKERGTLPPERQEMLSAAVKGKIINGMEKSKVAARIVEIDKYLENKQNLSITCRKEMYPGTKVTINDFVLQVKDKYQFCKIYLGDDGIQTETL